MGEVRKLASRKAAIAELLADGEKLKNFYRFAAQNPHIELYDACQIILARPDASVCFSFEDWNAMGRRIQSGSKGIPYCDREKNRLFVFDADDTYGEKRYIRESYPVKRLLTGFDFLNNKEQSEEAESNYEKVLFKVKLYLKRNPYIVSDKGDNNLFAEGIAYSLYCRTGFPKPNGIELHGLPWSVKENADFFKQVYITAAYILDAVEEANLLKQSEVKKIDDTEEETITDEPVISPVEPTEEEAVEDTKKEWEKSPSPLYKLYMMTQEKYPNAVTLMRVGDFYEVMGENAKAVAAELDLILTSRDVGLDERIPMCGFPYHVTDEYTEKILKIHSVVVMEDGEEKYICSCAEAVDQSEQETMLSIATEPKPSKKVSEATDKQASAETEKNHPSKDKPISQRKRKEKPQPTLFDILSPQGKPREEQLIEWGLQYGSGVAHGKYRIYETYQSDPSEGEFIEFLKQEYGFSYGAHFVDRELTASSKGLTLSSLDGERPEDTVSVTLTWKQVALGIADLIDEEKYFTAEEREEYKRYYSERHGSDEERIEAIADDAIYYFTSRNKSGEQSLFFSWLYADYLYFVNHGEAIAAELNTRTELESAKIDGDRIELKFANGSAIDRFRELSSEDKAFFEHYQARTLQEPRNSPWGEVQTCRVIADGIYEVSTAGHGGIMILSELAPHILSPEALQKGIRESGYYCYEEDCDACIPLRELYDKGILKQNNGYFAHYLVKSENPESKNGKIPFAKATETEKTDFIQWWNETIDESLAGWNGEYWQAHEHGKAQPNAADHESRAENTDLNAVFDQSELGGAKSRFKGNMDAIRLMNRLYLENREAAAEERKVLAKYVGWGGLAQAFDETNKQWSKEYAELKGLLSVKDYEYAKRSVLNAHYTSKEVIDGMYAALERFGVKGNNRILEPAMGTGNFFGYMPRSISDGAELYGVELDSLTGKIAQKLYPKANVQIKGFEETSFPNDYFDIVISNVPFGGYSVYDSEYAQYKFLIHDYFIAKSIDKVRANGLVAVITSKGTLDKLNPTVRRYLAERAELVGAIRLPNAAFKKSANTEVVTDILFFRKREAKIEVTPENTEWLTTGKTKEGYEVNNYFLRHPEMVLGTFAKEQGLYGGENITVKSDGRELIEAITEAVATLPMGFYENPEHRTKASDAELAVDYNVKPLCYKAEAGKLYIRIGDKMEERKVPDSPTNAYERISGMIEIREELHRILDMQTAGCTDEELLRGQWSLGKKYDLFVKRFGFLNSPINVKLFRDDGDSALVFACETLSEDKKSAKKADIFTKRTIRPYTAVQETSDCLEALQICRNECGSVDIEYIENLTKKDYATVLSDLGNTVFRNPEKVTEGNRYSGFETSEEYLSGYVVKKLETARRYAQENPAAYERNVKALEAVQPTPIPASDIYVNIGASWVDSAYYCDFLGEKLGIPRYYLKGLKITFNRYDGSWEVERSDDVRKYAGIKATEVYGTHRANAFRIFEDCLNQRDTTICDTVQTADGQKKYVVNQSETLSARERQHKMQDEFRDWIFSTPERREDLERTYNRLFNQIRLPKFDGSYLKFPNMNPYIQLYPHQVNAVQRILTNGSTLDPHRVGYGKTFTIVAAIMKLRQYGLAKKPMIVVPNHLIGQWSGEFRQLYANAKLLIAEKEDLEQSRRKMFVSKAAMGDWDAIIIAQSAFAKIPVSKERQRRKIEQEIEDIENSIRDRKEKYDHTSVKNLERIKKSREAALKRLMDDKTKDTVLTFENLGVDYLFVDESDAYKNLFLFTKMNNVSGISNAASRRASDMKLKCEYLNELHGGDKGVVFATGTPISNSLCELYTLQRYLRQNALNELGLQYFDSWAANFAEKTTALELAPSGQGYRTRTRFSKFKNLPELMTLYAEFADLLPEGTVKLDIPEAEKKIITLKPSESVIELTRQIAERADRVYQGIVDPHEDNMLKIASDGKKLALDPRCLDLFAADEAGNKLNACAAEVYEYWKQTEEFQGTQLVFCDLATPKQTFESYECGKNFDAYNELKCKLVEKGIPQEQIAYIHEAKNDNEKLNLFNKVNAGKIRILLGSTEKCGAGTNVQKRLKAIHHLDAPYRPRDLIQRNGRGVRQGNMNKSVAICTYVMERTFDSYSYQILENKQRFISQIEHGEVTQREGEDIDEATLSYAELKAITSANPKIKRKMEVDLEVSKLQTLEREYKKTLYSLQDRIRRDYPDEIDRQELYLSHIREDIKRIKANYIPETFLINVQGKIYTDKTAGGRALMEALHGSDCRTEVAEYGGFTIRLNPPELIETERTITLKGAGEYRLSIGLSESGNLTRLDNFLSGFSFREEQVLEKLKQINDNLETAKLEVSKPFEHKERLSELLREQAELNAELDLNKREEIVLGGEEESEMVGGEAYYRNLPEQTEIFKESFPEEEFDETVSEITEETDKEERMSKKKQEETEAYYINPLLKGKTNVEVHEFDKYFPHLKDGKKLYLEHYMDGWYVETILSGQELIEELKKALQADNGQRLLRNLSWEYKTPTATLEEINKGEIAGISVTAPAAEKQDNDSAISELLPDYTLTQQDMYEYGYKWSKMLPLRKEKAEQLYKAGATIYVLGEDNRERPARGNNDFLNKKGVYGIKKEDWRAFLKTDSAREYLYARLLFLEATKKAVSEMLGGGLGQDKFGVEEEAITKYFSNGKVCSLERLKPYVSDLMDEFSDMDESLLKKYGKTQDEFISDIKSFLPPIEERIENPMLTVIDRRESSFHKDNAAFPQGYTLLHSETFDNWYVLDDNAPKDEYGREMQKGDKATKYAILAYYTSWEDKFHEFASENRARIYYREMEEKKRRLIEAEETDRTSQNKEREEGMNKDKDKEMEHKTTDDLVGIDEIRENMREVVERKAQTRVPVYLKSIEYAINHHEYEGYRASLEESRNCVHDIAEKIRENYSNNILHTGYEMQIVNSYGLERVRYVLATIIRNNDRDERYSRENKAWAKTISIAEDDEERKEIYTSVHSGLLDLFTKHIRQLEKELTAEKTGTYHTQTAQGYKVLNMEKDNEGRNIAVVQRRDDYFVAIRYDPKDGTWAQGIYDFPTREEAERYRKEHYGRGELSKGIFEKSAPPNLQVNHITISVAKSALIKRFEKHSYFRMPQTGEYAGYTYNVYNHKIREAEKRSDKPEDFAGPGYEFSMRENETIKLKNRDGEEKIITAEAFRELVGDATDKDYETRRDYEGKKWFGISLPKEAMQKMYEKVTLFVLPKTMKTEPFGYYLLNEFIEEDSNSDDGRIFIRLPEDYKINAKNKTTGEKMELTAFELYQSCRNTKAEDYHFKRKEEEKAVIDGEKVSFLIPQRAKIAAYEKVTLLKLPKGEYTGFVCYVPNEYIQTDGTGFRLTLPQNFILKLSNKQTNEKIDLSTEQFMTEMNGKTDAEYGTSYQAPSETKSDKFAEQEYTFRKSIPDELKKRPNWTAVRIRKNDAVGTEEYIIGCHTGKPAEAGNPATWTDFESACVYAKENGCAALAYALDGKDGICCIELPLCKDKDGTYTELAQNIFRAAPKTYCENTGDKQGLRVLGTTQGMDLRSFSKDGDLKFYRNAKFLVLTCEGAGYQRLCSFDTPQMKEILESKCAKRSAWQGAGKGVEGLTVMSDRETAEKAIASKHGETFKALYDGQNLYGEPFRNDMSFMRRLAFWCNGDQEKMLRIFATSKLYCPEKVPDYYENMAITATEKNKQGIPPKAAEKSKSEENFYDGNEGNKKRL